MSEPNALDYEDRPQLADTRTIVQSTGWVDCFVCGKQVNIFKAFRVECRSGPTLFLHSACLNQTGPDKIGRQYQTTVWGVALNASDYIRGSQIQPMYDRRTKR